jgi:hypothetical protein
MNGRFPHSMYVCAESRSVTVVIPCWNAQKWVAEAIESGLGQSVA